MNKNEPPIFYNPGIPFDFYAPLKIVPFSSRRTTYWEIRSGNIINLDLRRKEICFEKIHDVPDNPEYERTEWIRSHMSHHKMVARGAWYQLLKDPRLGLTSDQVDTLVDMLVPMPPDRGR